MTRTQGMEYLIRKARLTDSDGICLVNKTALGYDYPLEKTRAMVERVLANGSDLLLVAETGGRIAGYVHSADYVTTYGEPQKNVLSIAVDEGFRGWGIGRALMAAVERWAADSGACGVRLVSGMDRNGAHRFYEACGYYHRKTQKNYVKRLS